MNIEINKKFEDLIPKNKLKSKYLNWVTFIVLLLVLFLAFIKMLFPIAIVEGTSMQPTINNSWTINSPKCDTVYTNVNGYFTRGDIVIVDLPNSNEQGIKRVIAIGGDSISFYANQLLVNGEVVNESYLINQNINERTVRRFNEFCAVYENTDQVVYNTILQSYVLTLEDNQVFYLGDNRLESDDCSNHGPQDKSCVIAKVVFAVPYGKNIFQYFWEQLCSYIGI